MKVNRFARRLILAAVLVAAALPALPARAAEGKVNINSADAKQLALLPRIGPAAAERILEYRKKNGAFKSAEDLMLVQGVGEKTFELLKPYLATSGETTLKDKVKASRAGSGKSSEKDEKGGAGSARKRGKETGKDGGKSGAKEGSR